MQYRTVPCSTVQYSAVHTVQYSAVQYSAVQCSTVQFSAAQYSTVQYSTVQLSQHGNEEVCAGLRRSAAERGPAVARGVLLDWTGDSPQA